MKKKSKFVIVTLAFLIHNPLLIIAEPNYLTYKNIQFPIIIDFPNQPEFNSMDHPLIPGSIMYYYISLATNESLIYNAVITTLPKNLGWIPKDTAQMMVDNSLETQIKAVDIEFNTTGTIIEENTLPLKGYPSKFVIVTRPTEPNLITYYRSVMVGQLLITIWANGIESFENKLLADKFITSLDIKQ